jgi:hypothetical protein
MTESRIERALRSWSLRATAALACAFIQARGRLGPMGCGANFQNHQNLGERLMIPRVVDANAGARPLRNENLSLLKCTLTFGATLAARELATDRFTSQSS